MFIEKYDGLYYIGSDRKQYELLEGVSSNGYTSDIVFILDRNEIANDKIIDFIYGGLKKENLENIKNVIENYIKEKGVF